LEQLLLIIETHLVCILYTLEITFHRLLNILTALDMTLTQRVISLHARSAVVQEALGLDDQQFETFKDIIASLARRVA
jgi:hypothetical protein